MKPSLHETLEKISSAATALGHDADLVGQVRHADFADSDLLERFAALAAQDNPPSNNMGGTNPFPPLFVPHGEKSGEKLVQKTKIDWLGFTSPAELENLQALLAVAWPDVMLVNNGRGIPGYPKSYAIEVGTVQYGMLGTGATHGRNFVSLTGTACKTLDDDLVEILYQALSLPELDIRLSRVDICLDIFDGRVTWDHAVRAYKEGRFKRAMARKNPEFRKIESGSDYQNFGRTFYVGKRDGEVMARVYEKGLEIFAKLPDELRQQCIEREASLGEEKFSADDWLRAEVEYKRVDKDRPLPLSMLVDRDRFFAGAYPYFEELLGRVDGLRPIQVKSDLDVDLVKMIHHAKRSYGSLIHSLCGLGFSPDEVVKELSSDRHNNKLIKSGLYSAIRAELDKMNIDPDADIPLNLDNSAKEADSDIPLF